MNVYIIVGTDWEESKVLGVCLTRTDAEVFLNFYKVGVVAANFESFESYDIEVHNVTVFEDEVTVQRQEEDR